MDAFTLAAKLVLDSSEYDENLKDAEQNATNSGAIISTAFKSVAAAATAITGATAAISTAFIKSTADVAAYGDNIDKMSQKMGMSAQAYQEWDAVMQHSGTSMETLKASMKTLANAAQTGSDAFKQLGISQEEIAKLSQEELFSRTITALQNVTDETQRTYLAGKTLGRGATELGALLNTSAEDTQKMKDRVHELGGVMSNEAVKAAAAYQDSLQDMTTAFDGLKRNMVSEFLPTVTTVMDGLTDLFAGDSEKGLGLINKGIQGFTDNLTDVLPKVLDTGTKIVISLADAVTQNLPALLDAGANAAAELATGIVKNLPSVVDAGMEAVLSLADGISDNLPELIPAATDAVIKIADTLTQPDNVSRLIDAGIKLTSAMLEGVIEGVPKLVDAAISAAGNLLESLTGLRGFSDFLKEQKTIIEAAIGALVAYKAATAIADAISTAVTAVQSLTAAFTGMNAVAAMNPIGAIAAAAAGAFVLIDSAMKNSSKSVMDAADNMSQSIKGIATATDEVVNSQSKLDIIATKYEQINKYVKDDEEKKRQLKGLQEELNTLYGKEAEKLDLVNGKYDEQSRLLAEMNERELGVATRKAEKNLEEAQKKISETIQQMSGETIDYIAALGDEAVNGPMEEFARKYNRVLDEATGKYKGFLDITAQGFTFNFTGEEEIEDVIAFYTELLDVMEQTGEDGQGVADTLLPVFDDLYEYSKQLEDAGVNVDKLREALERLQNASPGTLAQDAVEQRLASYGTAKFIPTEALRQQQGGAAPTITTFDELTKPIEDTAKAGANLITAASKAASSTAKKTLTFATKEIGEYRDLGIDMFATLGKELTEDEEKKQKIAKEVWETSKKWAENAIKEDGLSYQDQVEIWTKVRDQFVVNSEQWIAANEKASEASKKMGDEQEKAADKLVKANEKAFDEAEKAINKLTDAYDKAFEKEKQTIMSSYGLFDEVPKSIQISGDQLLKNLTEQNNNIKKFYSDVDKLAARGVSFELVEEIRNMGVKASDELDALLDMTDEQLKEYDSLFSQRNTMSNDIAKANLEPLEQSTIQQIAEITDEALADIANNGKEIGESLASGMTVGMQESMTTVAQQVKDTAMAAWKDTFGTNDMTSVGTIAPELTSNATVNNDNKFTFNINGIQYQTITQLAKAVANEMQFLTNRRKAGYAGT